MELSISGKAAKLEFEKSGLIALRYGLLSLLSCKPLDLKVETSIIGYSHGRTIFGEISPYSVEPNENLRERILKEVDLEIERVENEIKAL